MNQHTGNHTIRIRHRHRSKVWLSGLRMETKNLHHIIVHHGITYRNRSRIITEKSTPTIGSSHRIGTIMQTYRFHHFVHPAKTVTNHQYFLYIRVRGITFLTSGIQLQLIHMAIIEPKRTSKRIGETPNGITQKPQDYEHHKKLTQHPTIVTCPIHQHLQIVINKFHKANYHLKKQQWVFGKHTMPGYRH